MSNTITTWCARLLLVLMAMGVAASAQAATIYNFTFDDSGTIVARGTFTRQVVGIESPDERSRDIDPPRRDNRHTSR